jgi:hypothetical protein
MCIAVGEARGLIAVKWAGASRFVQRSPKECDNDFSRRQEKNIFGQLNPGNGIETSGPHFTGRCLITGNIPG